MKRDLARKDKVLKEAAETWQITFDGISDPVWIMTPDYTITRCNRTFSEFLNMSEEAIIGKKCYELIHKTDKPVKNCPCRIMKKTKIKTTADINFNGRCLESTVYPMLNETGEIESIIIDAVDKTEKIQKNKQIEYQARLLEDVSDAIILTDMQFSVKSWNKGAQKVYGWKKEEVLGRPVNDMVKTEYPDGKNREEVIRRLMETGRYEEEVVQRTKSGSKIVVSCNVSLLKDEEGNPVGAVFVNRDITEQKKAEREEKRYNEKMALLSETAMALIELTGHEGFFTYIAEIIQQQLAEEAIIIIMELDERLNQFRVKQITGNQESNAIFKKLLGIDPHEMIIPETETIRENLLRGMLTPFSGDLYELTGRTLPKSTMKSIEKRLDPGTIFNMALRSEKELLGYVSIILKRGALLENKDVIEAFVNQASIAMQQRKSRTALLREKNRIQQYLDITGVMMVALDVCGIVTMVNRKGCEALGYSEEEIVGKNWFDNFIPEKIKPEIKMVANRLLAGMTDKVEYFENPVLTKDGRERLVAWNNTIIRDEDDNITGILSSGEDITELVIKEEALRQSEECFRQFFDNAPDYCYMVSPEDIILNINRAALSILGYAKAEIIGKPLRKIYADESLPVVNALHTELKEKGKIIDKELVIETKTGEKRDVLLSAAIVKDVSGGIVHSVLIQKDITEQKLAEKEREKLHFQLQQSRKMESIGQLAGGIAHDFNNILGGILGYSDVLEMKLGEKPELLKYIRKIKDASLKASDLTRKMLAFARRTPLDVTTVSVHDSILQVVEILQHTIDKRIEIKSRLNAEVPTVSCDIAQLESILLNIGINARDAMPEGGTIIFRTENVTFNGKRRLSDAYETETGEYVKISIIDTGIGMDEKIRQKIFEPFFSTKEIGKGTGLGLASVYGAVKQHHGYITVSSEPGRGAQFDIYLPVMEKEKKSDTRQIEEKPVSGTGTIMVIDDEAGIRDTVEELLKSIGYTVICCSNGIEAVEIFKEKNGDIDLVLLDMIMPKMNGVDCFRKLKEINPQVQVAITTGYSIQEDIDLVLREGAKEVIEKPFELNKLSNIVKEAIGH